MRCKAKKQAQTVHLGTERHRREFVSEMNELAAGSVLVRGRALE